METSSHGLHERSLLHTHSLPPNEIEAKSFEIIDNLVSLASFSPGEQQVVKRIVHTTGDPSIVPDIVIHPAAISSAIAAIRSGAIIYTDVTMVASGISRAIASTFGCDIRCVLHDGGVVERAREENITRTAASMLSLAGDMTGSIVAIGNAPTALLALADLIDDGRCEPAIVIAMPVGFVGAAESKAEIMKRPIPFISVRGTRGGSTLAVATVNALLRLASADNRGNR